MIGHKGLFVAHANLATLDIIKPMLQERIRDSSLTLFALSAYKLADQVTQLQITAKPITKRRLAGSCTLYARSPDSESRWKRRGFLMAADLMAGIPRSKGER